MSANTAADAGVRRLGRLPFVVGGLAFIPLLGVVFGLTAILWGFATKRSGGKQLAIVGAAGIICLTVLPYGALFYFGTVQRGGLYDNLRANLAQDELNSLVETVEFYKLNHGDYPDSLESLQASLPKNSLQSISVRDPRLSHNDAKDQFFFYRRIDSGHYYLRGLAPDGKPFSPGSLVSQVANPNGRLGLLVDPPGRQDVGTP